MEMNRMIAMFMEYCKSKQLRERTMLSNTEEELTILLKKPNIKKCLFGISGMGDDEYFVFDWFASMQPDSSANQRC